ncbi:MAG TPA: (2Fe-2S) ferredoxin domain-containing protein [Candidatus Ozemobacteraceae bacterium]|nr:(2Fe-2S) ferredoxin domain-containing protein [Candidatus Ozemobacteraceae bacterium]
MKKIIIRICSGTTCFVMGAAELQTLAEHLPLEMKERVEIQLSHCLGLCNDRNFSRAPFVTIDSEPMGEATIPGIIARLETLAGGKA